MRNCKECNAALNDKAKFCKECGAKTDNLNVTFDRTETFEAPEFQAAREMNNTQSVISNEQSNTMTLDIDLVKSYLVSYVEFLKETLMRPASLFESKSWINGLISIVVFALVQMTVVNYDHIANLVTFLIYQGIVVGVLLLINKVLLNTPDTFYNVVTEYGGLLNTQTILFIIAGVIGLDEGLGAFIIFVALLNQFNIFNYYLFKNQTKGTRKLDGYYQIVIAYIALTFLLYYVFRGFLNF